jgi:hypothetical protein
VAIIQLDRHNVRAADGLGFIVRTLNHFERKSKCPPAQQEAYRSVSAIVHNILFEEPILMTYATAIQRLYFLKPLCSQTPTSSFALEFSFSVLAFLPPH